MQEVFKWVEQYGGTICSQLRRIGSSLDWSRQVLLPCCRAIERLRMPRRHPTHRRA